MLEQTEWEAGTNYKAIACENIPDLFLDKIVAKKYFSKFGKIKRFILRPKRLSCTVEYESKEDAENAYRNAGNFNGIDFKVNYANFEIAHVQNTEEWVDPDVQAELDAMSSGQRKMPFTGSTTVQQKSNVIGRTSKYASVPIMKLVKVQSIGRQESPLIETKVDNVVRSELETILKTPAITDEEKYRVLDARDKLIRMTTIRQTDINKAVAIKGTCPDMCPEKERLMREFQRQVSIFEMADEKESVSTISHKKAVKEYSRSSADQEVPLSHELRSEKVLQMTMVYLVHRVMGLCDDPKTSIGDWFHFVWDRTRSIRKDITQQELCSLGAVELVEQCARFHIHCAARLVAEEPSVFDKKINAENLTKCLQTLKYMYHDLRIKGIYCPCEAEFRSYVILLNLGDSNFLWEIKQLPEIIQKNKQVKQAIAFYNALQNNNFVRFFSMIKSAETSYLSACILLGYFTKLRLRAMDAIIKSHNWRKNDVHLPLSYLTRILGFDSESSAVSFFSYYGLQCDVFENRVLLDRLSKPEIEYGMDRALKLVESKRHISVGECVYGKTLPPTCIFENHQPHNSFDESGILKHESWTAMDQLRDKSFITDIQKKDQYSSLHNDQLRDKSFITNIQKKDQYSSLHNDLNLFKKPHNISPVSHNQRKKHQEKNVLIETSGNEISSVTVNKNEPNIAPGGFKFTTNIFEDKKQAISSNEPVFNLSNSLTNTNEFLSKPSNIFGGIVDNNIKSKDRNIFGAAIIETGKIFKQQTEISTHHFNKDNVFKFLQSNNISNNTPPFKTKNSAHGNEFNKEPINVLQGQKMHLDQLQNEQKSLEFKTSGNALMKQDNQAKPKKSESMNKLKIILEESTKKEYEKILNSFIDAEVFDMIQIEVNCLQLIAQVSDLQSDLLISEVIKVCVEDIANEEYALMCYDQLLLNRYFSRWLLHFRKKKQQRVLMENTPLWITTNTRAQYAQALKHPCQQKNMQMIKRYRLGQPCDFDNILKLEQDMLYKENQNQINLYALVRQHLLSQELLTYDNIAKQRKYFKFIITIPGYNEELLGFENFFNNWLLRFIKNAQLDTGPFVHGIEHNIALCVRKFSGINPKNEQGEEMTTEGDHNDGVICIITGKDTHKHSRKRLYNLLKLTKNLKRVPLAIIAYNCSYNKEELSKILELNTLQTEGFIHSYIILGCQVKRKDFSFRKLFISAVNFITKESILLNANEMYALSMLNLQTFLEITLGEETWQRWSDSAYRNPIFNKICSMPEHAKGIFHKALDHLLHIVQGDFNDMPEFPEDLKEFVPQNNYSNLPLGLEYFPLNWKKETKKDIIKTFLKSLYLPNMEENIPTDIEDIKIWLMKYSSICIDNDEVAATKAAYEAISNIVTQINIHNLHNIKMTTGYSLLNYLLIIKPIVFGRINYMLKYFHSKLKDLNVFYLKDDLNIFQTQPWWLNYEPLNFVIMDYSSPIGKETPEKPVKEPGGALEDVDKILAKAEKISHKTEYILTEIYDKRNTHNDISNTNITSTLQLKRKLDDTIYKFELSKKIGEFDTTVVTCLTSDIDKTINEVFDKSSPTARKRKRTNLIASDQCTDIEEVVAKAMKIIKKIESTEDQKFKTKKI